MRNDSEEQSSGALRMGHAGLGRRVSMKLLALELSVVLAGGVLACGSSRGAAATNAVQVSRQVQIETGAVEGVKGPHGTTAFFGIPYAAPPTGGRRWQPPHRAALWNGIRIAGALGPSCPQVDRSSKMREVVVAAYGGDPAALPPQGPPPLGITDEDCLSLNVFTPELGGKRPVMVWLHGGSFAYGSGGEDAAILAPQGVVVVTINYRLGALGFLAHPALTRESPHRSSGNYGLLDQIEALGWVQRNIAAFGGDPNRVTIFGHSAGAVSVLMLLTSPGARGLFQRAIAQSSSLDASPSLSESEARGVEIAKGLGAPTADPLRALRSETVERILSVAPSGFEPTMDGWVLSEPVHKALERDRGIPLLVGATAREWGIFAIRAAPASDRASYRELLRKASSARWEQLLALYPTARDEDVPAAAIRFLTDWDFICPARHVAAIRRDPSWLYLLSAPPAATAPRHGAVHGSDLRLLFRQEMGMPLGEIGERVGAAMQRYWVRFALTGDPNEPALPAWPIYDAAKPRHLDLGDPVRASDTRGREACDLFDEKLLGH